MSTETNFDFFLFLLNTWDVTNGIISGFDWRTVSVNMTSAVCGSSCCLETSHVLESSGKRIV